MAKNIIPKPTAMDAEETLSERLCQLDAIAALLRDSADGPNGAQDEHVYHAASMIVGLAREVGDAFDSFKLAVKGAA